MSDVAPECAIPVLRRQLRAVAMFEATKGVFALLAAAGLHLLGPEPLQRTAQAAAAALRLHPSAENSRWLARLVAPETVHVAILLALAYGLMRLVEAWGLWRERAWASWFGALSAAAYLPVEAVTFWRHPHWLTAAVIAINLLVVWILARDLWRRRR